MYEFLAIESGIDLLSEVSELLVVSLELFVDSLLVEFVVFGFVVAEVLDTGERSGESLGSGLHVVGEGAEIIDLPSEEFLVRAEIIGFGRVLEVLVVEAAFFPFVYVLDVVVVSIKSFVDSVESSGVVHEVSRGGSSEVGSLGDDVGNSLTSNVEADRSVSLVTFVASASLATVSVVSAGSVDVAWVGAGTDITPAEVGSVDVSSEVETVVAVAGEVVLLVGARSISLAWAGGARVNPAVDSVTVETVVASTGPLGGAVDVWELDSAGGVGGAVITAAAGVWDAVRSISVVIEEASAAGADGFASIVGAVGVGAAWVGGAGIEVASVSEASGVTASFVELFDGLEVVVVVAGAGSSSISGDAAGGVILAGGVLAGIVDAGTDLSEALWGEVKVAFGASAGEVPASAVGAVGVVTARLPVGDIILGDNVVVVVLDQLSDRWGVGAGILSSAEITNAASVSVGKGNN
jgi:hypothetical protein